MSKKRNEKNKEYIFPMSTVINIEKLEKYWDLNLDIIEKNKDWKRYMQCNLFWNDKNKSIIDNFYYCNVSKNKSLLSSEEFYDYFSYKQNKLFDNKINNVIVISSISWLYINSYYLKIIDEFDDNVLYNDKIKTFFPYMNKEEKYLESWENFRKYLKKYIGDRCLKIDIKSFYSNINIDNFAYFCYLNYKYIQDNYSDFVWVLNLISYYSRNDSFPLLEHCPFLSFCSSKLLLRKYLIEVLSDFEYSNTIKKIIHYMDDIWIIFNEKMNENEISKFYNKFIDLFNEKNISLNMNKTKYYNELILEDIENDINSMEIKEINSQNNKKITYEYLNEYLIKFNKHIQKNKNKLMSFFEVENSIETNWKLKDFVFLKENKIIGNVNSMTFFESIDSKEFVNMINIMPKYFISIFDKFLSKYNTQNNPFKLINKEWENLSKEIFVYYSMVRSFKKIEKNMSEIILEKNGIDKIINIKNNWWFCYYRKNDKASLNENMIQNMFFQIFYLYKKSKNHKYLAMFILSCSVVIEMLNKHKGKICKDKEKCKKNFYSCSYLNLFNDEEKEICKKIISYRDANSLIHNNFANTENIIFNVNFNIDDLFQIAKKILEFIRNI